MTRKTLLLFTTLMITLFFSQVFSQEDELESVPVHKRERAISFSLASNGFGLGGVYRWTLPHYMHAGVNLEFFIVRDDDELELIDPFTGIPFKINDANRLFLIPANIELKKRLFHNDIEDDFRPHLMVSAGAMFGMNFPKEQFVFDDAGNRTRVQAENEFQFAWNLLFGFGVDFTTKKDVFATLRPQYRLTFFSEEIAGKKEHHAFEIKFEIGGQF